MHIAFWKGNIRSHTYLLNAQYICSFTNLHSKLVQHNSTFIWLKPNDTPRKSCNWTLFLCVEVHDTISQYCCNYYFYKMSKIQGNTCFINDLARTLFCLTITIGLSVKLRWNYTSQCLQCDMNYWISAIPIIKNEHVMTDVYDPKYILCETGDLLYRSIFLTFCIYITNNLYTLTLLLLQAT